MSAFSLTLLFVGTLVGSASADANCAADEMDLCDGIMYYPNSATCLADEMDLCEGIVDYPGSARCMEDEMDLCEASDMPTTTMMMAPTTTMVQTFTISGTISLTYASATKAEVEQATQGALSAELNVPTTAITTTATESRRLAEESSMRRLAGNWVVDYTVTAEESKRTAITTTTNGYTADASTFGTALKTQFTSMGKTDVDTALTVNTFTAAEVFPSTTALPNIETSSLAYKLSGKLSVALVVVAATLAKPAVTGQGADTPVQ